MEIKILKNLVYTKTEREYLTADVYLPTEGDNHPVVIMVHGGAFQAGSKEMYNAWGPFLAKNGIAAISINYRLATPNYASYPGLLQDMEDAINFVVKNSHDWNLDPTNIGFMGDSAGAYLGSMAAFNEERASAKIKFVVCAYGVMDITDWAEYTNATREDFVINKMFGQDAYTGRYVYQNACPMHLIDKAVRSPLFNTSFYMVWGEDDEVVLPKNQTLAFIKKLDKYKIYYEKKAVPKFGHFWFTKNDNLPINEFEGPVKDIAPNIIDFINRVVNKTYISDPESNK